MILLYVAIGGAIGSVFRYLTMTKVDSFITLGFPFGTMVVNILGSFLMGVFIGSSAKYLPVSNELRAFVAIGVLGGFTTFSTFSLDLFTLIERGDLFGAVFYSLGSFILSVAAIIAGLYLIRFI